MADNICRNCKWAVWAMTNHQPQRVNKRTFGRCEYPMDRVAIPVCVGTQSRISEGSKGAIWWNNEIQCRVWEKK